MRTYIGVQDGQQVFRVDCDDPSRAFSEALHYLRQYEQDGLCDLFMLHDGKRVKVTFVADFNDKEVVE